MVPCSHAAHLYRGVAWVKDLSKEKPNNNDRVIAVWMDDYAPIFREMGGNKSVCHRIPRQLMQSGNKTVCYRNHVNMYFTVQDTMSISAK